MTYHPRPVPTLEPEASDLVTDEYTVVHALPDVTVQHILAVSESDWNALMAIRADEARASWQ